MSLTTRRRLLPWLFIGPGLLWLLLFFLYPLLNQASVSLMSGNPEQGYTLTWAFHTYWDAICDYKEQFGRSIVYAGIATLLCLIIAFPLAYFTAFHAGRWKNLILLLIILPFFMSYVLRTVAWQLILSDDGGVVSVFRWIGLLSDDGRLLASRTAVIAGITYNFLPFMALPLYVALEKIDTRLLEAATDLYASRATAFRKVTLPLALPGIFAGSLLTFIPACGDFINAALLGHAAPVHDRQRHPVEVPEHPRLPDGRGPELHADGLHPDRHLHLRAAAGRAEPDRGGDLMAVVDAPRAAATIEAPPQARRQVARPPAPRAARPSGRRSRCCTCSSRSSSSSCSRSTTTRAGSTSPGRASPCATGRIRSRTPTCRRR